MNRTTHPADAANAELAARAVRFDVSLFLGAGAFATAAADTKEGAVAAALKLQAEYPDCSRIPLIYAVTADGRSALVELKEIAMTIKVQNDKSNARKRLANFRSRFADVQFQLIEQDGGWSIEAELTDATAHHAKVLRKQGIKVSVPVSVLTAVDALEAKENEKSGDAIPSILRANADGRATTAPAAEPKAAPKPMDDKPLGKRAAVLAAAQAGQLPEPPDFSAATHARFRGKLADLVKLAKAGDIEGLKAYAINPVSSSPKALDKYRNLCVIALQARRTKIAA